MTPGDLIRCPMCGSPCYARYVMEVVEFACSGSTCVADNVWFTPAGFDLEKWLGRWDAAP